MLTVVEVHLNVVTSDVGSHGHNGSAVKLSDQMAGRDTIHIGHDDIHQDQIVLDFFLDLVHRLDAVKLGKLAARLEAGRAGGWYGGSLNVQPIPLYNSMNPGTCYRCFDK